MNESSAFYPYSLGSNRGRLKVDGNIEEVSGAEPFFREFSPTGSGHPSGYTYGWVMNDDQNLYVAMDFTPDNTMDGEKDYAKVYVNTADGLKKFKVSVPETAWGSPGFTYTERVGYQHKVYEFVIPLSESLRQCQRKILGTHIYGLSVDGVGAMIVPAVNHGVTSLSWEGLRSFLRL